MRAPRRRRPRPRPIVEPPEWAALNGLAARAACRTPLAVRATSQTKRRSTIGCAVRGVSTGAGRVAGRHRGESMPITFETEWGGRRGDQGTRVGLHLGVPAHSSRRLRDHTRSGSAGADRSRPRIRTALSACRVAGHELVVPAARDRKPCTERRPRLQAADTLSCRPRTGMRFPISRWCRQGIKHNWPGRPRPSPGPSSTTSAPTRSESTGTSFARAVRIS